MSSESKILTVSYGSFSCTLEGYDDPFATMKAIAEYFRDLAAEDRYFGSEPPQPDAAMLHRIAEREVARLIDGKTANAFGSGARARGQRSGQETAKSAVVIEPSVQEVMPAGVAAKLSRIRQSVERDTMAADLSDETRDVATKAPASEPERAEASARDAVDALLRVPDDGAVDAAPAMADQSEHDIGEVDVAIGSDTGTDLAGDDLSFDAPFADGLDDTAPDADEAILTPDTALLSDMAEDVDLDPGAIEDVVDDLTVAAVVDPLPEEDAAADSLYPDSIRADAQAAEDASFETMADEILAEAFAEDQPKADVSEDAVAAAEEQAAPADLPSPGFKTAAKTKRVNSRVVRIHPDDDTDDAPADPKAARLSESPDNDADVSRLLRHADKAMSDDEAQRRSESMAKLRGAFAATEADRQHDRDVAAASDAATDDDGDTEQPADKAPLPHVTTRRRTISVRPEEPRATPKPLVLVSEQRIDRTSPAAQPSFSPAALVPTPAAASIAPGISSPGGQGAMPLRTGRLTGAIGLGAAKPVAALTPQGVTMDNLPPSSFAEAEEDDDADEILDPSDVAGLQHFADQVGVKSIADLLEAAAAYATCIEGREQFTRPQLMRRLTAASAGKPVSREEGLRSFGTLLRTGRIEKVSRGNYVLAVHSPYLAEARRIG